MLRDYSKFVELKRVPVIDVPITGTNMSEYVEFLTRHIDELHGEYICVSNAHTSVMAHDDPSYWACQADSLMSVPDGKPLSVVGRKTIESMGRVSGPDLMREIFSISLPTIRSTSGKGTEAKYLSAAVCRLSAAALIRALSLLFKAATSAVVLGMRMKSSPVIKAS